MADRKQDAKIYIYGHISFSLGMRFDSVFGLAEENPQRISLLVDIAHLVPGNESIIFVKPVGAESGED
jgi:hypothetical protein